MCWGDRFRIQELEKENIRLQAEIDKLKLDLADAYDSEFGYRARGKAEQRDALVLGGRESASNVFPEKRHAALSAEEES